METTKKLGSSNFTAAITAMATIYMYPYISRVDSYYMDTDSVVLSQPLPLNMISTTEIGKFKLEDHIIKVFSTKILLLHN